MTGKLSFITALATRLSQRPDAQEAPAATEPPTVDVPVVVLTPAVEAVLGAIARLKAVLEHETELLRLPQPDDAIAELVQVKGDAEAKYRGAVSVLQYETGGVGGLAPEVRETLTAAARSLADAAKANIEAVTSARDSQKRLVELIVESLKKERRNEVGYGHLARTASSPYVRPLPPAPAALSRVL